MKITRRLSSRDAILVAAFNALPSRPDTSLAEIADLAGVGRATLHRHFKGRDDLILSLTQAALHDMDHAVDAACQSAQSYTQALKSCLDTLIPLGDRFAFLNRETGYDHPDVQAELDRQDRELRELITQVVEENGLSRTIPVDWHKRCFDAVLMAAWSAVEVGELTSRQACDLAWSTLTHSQSIEPSKDT